MLERRLAGINYTLFFKTNSYVEKNLVIILFLNFSAHHLPNVSRNGLSHLAFHAFEEFASLRCLTDEATEILDVLHHLAVPLLNVILK